MDGEYHTLVVGYGPELCLILGFVPMVCILMLCVQEALTELIRVLDAFHLALISHAMYLYLVTDFGSFLAITRSARSLCVRLTLSLFI